VPIKRTTLECPVLLRDVSAGRFRVELKQYIKRPKAANLLLVILSGGYLVQRQLIDGGNEPGGWRLINVGQLGLTFEAIASGWKWTIDAGC
jgi:hypothetical protein